MEDQTRQGSFSFSYIMNVLRPILIINEFAHIAYSGCQETLDSQGLKPSLVKQITKTWKLKARVFHETRMLGLLTNKTFYMAELTVNYDNTMSPLFIKYVVMSKQNAARSMGITYLSLLKLCCLWQTKYNRLRLNNIHMTEEESSELFDALVQEALARRTDI